MKCYYINLCNRVDRKTHMEAQLTKLGLPFERVTGVNGYRFPSSSNVVDTALFERSHGRSVRAGEVGCFLSHLKALARFLQEENQFAVILEDDAVFAPETRSIIDRLCGAAHSQWDLVKLQTRRNLMSVPVSSINGRHSLNVPFSRSTGATAYLVNRKAAARLIDKLLPIEAPYDHAFDRPFQLGLRMRAVVPHPVSIDPALERVSSIEVEPPKKLRGIKKTQALFWRSRSEVGRFISGCGALLSHPPLIKPQIRHEGP